MERQKSSRRFGRGLGESFSSFRGSFRSLLGSSFRNLPAQQVDEEWVCGSCSYRNIDSGNSKCSVCGLARYDPMPPPPALCSLSSEESSLTSGASQLTGREPNQMTRGIPKRTMENTSMETSTCDGSSNYKAQSPVSSAVRSCEYGPVSCTERRPSIKAVVDELATPKRVQKFNQERCHRGDNKIHARPSPAEPRNKHCSKPTAKEGEWECCLCTYLNENPLHLACAVCGHKRSEESTTLSEDQNPSARRTSVPGEQSSFINEREQEKDDEVLKSLKEERMKELIEYQNKILEDLQKDTGNNQCVSTEKEKEEFSDANPPQMTRRLPTEQYMLKARVEERQTQFDELRERQDAITKRLNAMSA